MSIQTFFFLFFCHQTQPKPSLLADWRSCCSCQNSSIVSTVATDCWVSSQLRDCRYGSTAHTWDRLGSLGEGQPIPWPRHLEHWGAVLSDPLFRSSQVWHFIQFLVWVCVFELTFTAKVWADLFNFGCDCLLNKCKGWSGPLGHINSSVPKWKMKGVTLYSPYVCWGDSLIVLDICHSHVSDLHLHYHHVGRSGSYLPEYLCHFK